MPERMAEVRNSLSRGLPLRGGPPAARNSGPESLTANPPSALRRAAEQVGTQWGPVLIESFDAAEYTRASAWCLRAIDSGWYRQEIPGIDGDPTLGRFLLERMESALLVEMERDPEVDKAGALRLLRALDDVRRAVEPAWDRYFASQICGPDGLNLVLEVAHDLRSPLTSIRCLAESIERGSSGPVTELQRKQLRLIYSASLGLSSMATDVIEMARRGDQLFEGEPVPFSISELLEGVADLVGPMAAEKGLTFSYQRLPLDMRVGLPLPLSRVLLNLVSNACKFTDEGRVEVQLRQVGLQRVEFAVVDSGRGIPESAIPDLFRPFRRANARQGKSGYLFSGTGLGLALCRKLLGAMGSELKFTTELNVGTKFFFELELPLVTRL
jgi:signal transduction histidine kinase